MTISVLLCVYMATAAISIILTLVGWGSLDIDYGRSLSRFGTACTRQQNKTAAEYNCQHSLAQFLFTFFLNFARVFFPREIYMIADGH